MFNNLSFTHDEELEPLKELATESFKWLCDVYEEQTNAESKRFIAEKALDILNNFKTVYLWPTYLEIRIRNGKAIRKMRKELR